MKASPFYLCMLVLIAVGGPGHLLAQGGSSSLTAPGMADGAPPELMHWGKMVGSWSTTEESLNPNTSEWQRSESADWDFHWAFNGWGIADNYTSPPLSQPLDYEPARQRGINLRIYNPVEKKWVLTWLTVGASKALTMTAVSSDDEIVMLSDEPNEQGRYSRITFFDITENSFEWKLEWSADQNIWLEVYRIHGTRKTDGVSATAAEPTAIPASQAVIEVGDTDVYEPELTEPDALKPESESFESPEELMEEQGADDAET